MLPFETAQDIIGALRDQFAYLMQRGLTVQSQLRIADPVLRTLSGRALRLAIDRPLGWQPQLLAQVLSDEIDGARDRRRTHDLGIAFGVGRSIPGEAVPAWALEQLHGIERLATGLSLLFNQLVSTSLGADDISEIVLGARQIGKAYSEALNWAAEVRKTTVPDGWRALLGKMPTLIDDLLASLEGAGPRLKQLVDEAIATTPEMRKPIDLTIKVKLTNEEAFLRELDRLLESDF